VDDPVARLQVEFAAREAAAMERLAARQRRNRRNGALAGAMTGLVAVAATAGVTRRAIFWHSFLLEAILCALAGWLLARRNGGVLRGMLLFSGAYLLAFLLRALGLDPTAVFAVGDLRGATAVQGNFMSLALVVSCGAAAGHVMQE